MISPMNLIKMAKKWQKVASLRRKRISSSRAITSNTYEEPCSSSSRAEKGHFNVYTVDRRRFMIRLAYLENEIFRKLLEVAEEEFGTPRDGPIVLPCDAAFMEQVLCITGEDAAKGLQKALYLSIESRAACHLPMYSEINIDLQ